MTQLAACSCCGEEKPTATLRSREDVTLCRNCLEWLLGHIGVSSTPTLPVVDLATSIAFYEQAGFGVRPYRDESGSISGFAFVDFDGQSVFDLSVEADMDPATNHSACYLITPDADAWHERMRDAGLDVTAHADQPWGMREYALTDPSGNQVRIGRGIDDDSEPEA